MRKTIFILLVSFFAINNAIAQKAFSNLSLGLELGTNGLGLELASPLIPSHLVLKAGVDVLFTPDIQAGTIEVEDPNKLIREIQQAEQKYGTNFMKSTLSPIPIMINCNATNIKLLFEYYPSEKSSFHIIAGIYYGTSNNIISTNIHTIEKTASEFSKVSNEFASFLKEVAHDLLPEHSDYKDINFDNPSFGFAGKYYELSSDPQKGYSLPIDIVSKSKVKPYLGIGFGRSIPETRFAFQFDLGAWYNGKLDISSQNEIKAARKGTIEIVEGAEFLQTLSKFTFLPQLNIRLIYRIF